MYDYQEIKELLKRSKILIVEDDRILRMLLRNILEDSGFYNIEEATDGKEGWEKTLKIDPDLVILDINMPIMDGFEYCKIARKHPEHKDTIILVQTGITDLEAKAKIFEEGATDYITKPHDFHEIAARTEIHLKNALNLKELNAFNKRVKEELKSATSLIEAALPNEFAIKSISEDYKIDLAAKFESTQEMGGDFWGFIPIDKSNLAVYSIDVSGHGIDSTLSALRIHTLLHANASNFKTPGEVLEWTNNKLAGLFPVGQFATAFYGIINTKKNILEYATAACPSPIIMGSKGGDTNFISGKGFPLGAVKDADFKTLEASFKPSDTLILYSDAITEAINKDGELYGEKRFLELLQKTFAKQKDFSSDEALKETLKHFHSECGEKLTDDLTVNFYYRS
jgi:sigma-B regulation protein RsbU (phosphoserine phosphatase)